MSFKKCLVLFLAVTVNALATPHAVRHNHRAIAARVAAPAPLDIPVLPFRKRQNTKRCKQRSSSLPGATSSSVSSVVVKPTPTTPDAAPPPSPTTKKETTHTPAPTQEPSTPAPPPATPAKSGGGSSNEPSYLVGTQTGQGTFYATGLGACGITNTDTDFIAAVSHLLFDSFPGYNGANPNNNPVCNRKVTATYQGKTVTVTITDRCTGCALTDLDFSPAAFNTLSDPAVGRISGMNWVWD